LKLITALRKVEQLYVGAENFLVFHEQAKTVLIQTLETWEEDVGFEVMVEESKRRRKEEDARRRGESEAEPRNSGDTSELELEFHVRHDIAREHVNGMISTFKQTTSSSGGSDPVDVFRKMGMQLRQLLVVDHTESRVISDAFVEAIQTGTTRLEDIRDMIVAGRVGMSLQLAPVIAQMLATGAVGRPPRFLHDAVELVRRDLERRDEATRILSLVRQPPHSPVRARYIVEDENFQMQLEISGALLPMTEQTLQEIAKLEQEMEESRATNNYALSIASFFRACQVALTDMTYMSSSRNLFASSHVNAQRLRALRSDPELYKAWVDDMCQVSEPLPCNDTP
jgi:hypothetical protein